MHRFLILLYAFIIPIFFVSCVSGTQTQQENCQPKSEKISVPDFDIDQYNQPITWSNASFPISVVISPSFDEYETVKIIEGIEYWNKKVGKQVFLTVLGLSNDIKHVRYQIRVTKHNLPVVCNKQLLGLATRKIVHNRRIKAGYIVSSHIEIHNKHIHDKRYLRTVIHELGHALGLNHDEDEKSVMYPKILDSEWEIEQKDLNIIRSIVREGK